MDAIKTACKYLHGTNTYSVDFHIPVGFTSGQYSVSLKNKLGEEIYKTRMLLEENHGYYVESYGVNVNRDIVFSIDSEINNSNIYKQISYFSHVQSNEKVSVVIAYRKRLEQFKATLISISKTSYDNVEIIIVVDDDDDTVLDLKRWLLGFRFPVKLVGVNKKQTDWSDGGICINAGACFASGDILMIQSPECFHVGDIISHCRGYVSSNNYLLYACCGINSPEYTNKIINRAASDQHQESSLFYNGIRKCISEYIPSETRDYFHPLSTWYVHPIYHSVGGLFCGVIRKSTFDYFGGFEETLRMGVGYTDTDFFSRVLSNNIRVEWFSDKDPFILHLKHSSLGSSEKLALNKKINSLLNRSRVEANRTYSQEAIKKGYVRVEDNIVQEKCMFDKVVAHTSFIGETGYANHSRSFFTALNKLIPVKVRNFTVGKTWGGLNSDPHGGEFYVTDEHRDMIYKQSCTEDAGIVDFLVYNHSNEEDVGSNINIVLNETNHFYFYSRYKGPKIAYNVWESTLYPESFFKTLLDFNQLWVPTIWQKECAIKQGYPEERIKVVPEAVDGSVFFPEEVIDNQCLSAYQDGRFKFLLFGRWDYRKSTKEIISTFLKTFSPNEPVDLIVSVDNKFATDKLENTRMRLVANGLSDPRIKILDFVSREDYVKYLKQGHVYLSCSRSEGWGLPLIEAMACGTPVIYSNWGAQLEFAMGKGLPVNIAEERLASRGTNTAYKMIGEDVPGYYCEPDFNHLSKVMRDSYINYKEYKRKAVEESKEIREKFSWENAAKKAYIILEEFSKHYDSIPNTKRRNYQDLDIVFDTKKNDSGIDNPCIYFYPKPGCRDKKVRVVFKDYSNGIAIYSENFVFNEGLYYWSTLYMGVDDIGGILVEIFENEILIIEETYVYNSLFSNYKFKNIMEYSSLDTPWSTYKEMCLDKVCYHEPNCFVEKGDICVDLGAHYGFFSICASDDGASKVYSVEPVVKTFSHLKTNTRNYDNIIPLNVGISDSSGKKNINCSNVLSHSSFYDGVLPWKEETHMEEIAVMNINDLVKSYQIGRIDFLKVDIEGEEYNLFETISEDYLSSNIRKMSIECHNNGNIQNIVDKLSKCGFRCDVVESRGNGDRDKMLYAWKFSNDGLSAFTDNICVDHYNGLDIRYPNMNNGYDYPSIKDSILEHRVYEKYFSVQDGDVIVDIGSHIGCFPLSFRDKKIKRYYGIEPDNLSFCCLVQNMRYLVHDDSDKCILMNKAIDTETGCFYFKNYNVAGSEHQEVRSTEYPIRVFTTSFSDMIKQLEIDHIDFLKIDCEGGEYDVFKDENFDFIRNHVSKIAGEIHLLVPSSKQKGLDILNFLRKAGFTIVLNSIDGIDITSYFESNIDYYTEIMFYAVHEESYLTKKNNNTITSEKSTTCSELSSCNFHGSKIAFVVGSNEAYLSFLEICVKSIRHFTNIPIIAYGFGCDILFDNLNLIKRRIEVVDMPKIKYHKDKDILFTRVSANIDAIENENFDYYICLDADFFAYKNLLKMLDYVHLVDNYPINMIYKDETIVQWKRYGEEYFQSQYGDHICSMYGVEPRNNGFICANGISIFNKQCKWFFEEMISISRELTNDKVKFFRTKNSGEEFLIDDMAFSEERIFNLMMWKYHFNKFLPVTIVSRSGDTIVNNDTYNFFKDCQYKDNCMLMAKENDFDFVFLMDDSQKERYKQVPRNEDQVIAFHQKPNQKNPNLFVELLESFSDGTSVDSNSGIFVIGAWADTSIKEEMLKRSIGACRECLSSEILLVTHFPVSFEIQKMVDYYIYDKENPLLFRDEFPKYEIQRDDNMWYSSDEYNITCHISWLNDYAIWSSFRNAFNFAAYLGKKDIYYLEFDVPIDPVLFKEEFIDPLDVYRACLKRYSLDNRNYNSGVFSIKVEDILRVVNKFESKEQFYNDHKNKTFEDFFGSYVCDVVGKDLLFEVGYEKIEDIGSSTILGCRPLANYSNVYFTFCIDEQDYCFLFLDLRGNTNDFKLSITYNGNEEEVSVNGSSCFVLLGIDDLLSVKDNVEIYDNNQSLLKLRGTDILNMSRCSSVSFKNKCFKDNYTWCFKKKSFVDDIPSVKLIENNSIFVIDAWADNEEKESILSRCVSRIKFAFGMDILLVTHYPVSKEIQESVDYYIYDHHNPTLSREDAFERKLHSYWWFATEEFRADFHMKFRHDYAIWASWRNAFGFAKYLKKENICFSEFDFLFDTDCFRAEFISPLGSHNACFKQWPGSNNRAYESGIFSVKTDLACSITNSIKTKDQYYDTMQEMSSDCLEGFLFKIVEKNESQDHIYVIDKSKEVSQSLISVRESSVGNDNVLERSVWFCKDDSQYCYIMVICENFINSDICIKYSDMEECFPVDGQIPYLLIGVDFFENISGGATIGCSGHSLYKSKEDLLNEFSFGYVEAINGNSLLKFQSCFSGRNKKICNLSDSDNLMIVAHPDDESIFGGSLLLSQKGRWKVVCTTCGKDLERRSEFELAMREAGVDDYEIWDFDSSLNSTYGDCDSLEKNLRRVVSKKRYSRIVTHNADGEYGHLQHKFLHIIVSRIVDENLYVFSDTGDVPSPLLWKKINLLKNYKSQISDSSKQFPCLPGYANFIYHEDIVPFIKNKDYKITEYSDVTIKSHFIGGPFVEILGERKEKYHVIFRDLKNSSIIHETDIENNCWTKASRQWFTRYQVEIFLKNKRIFENTLNLKDKRVLICFESKSLGDSLAWIPYVDAFRIKHHCHVVCSTFWNDLFKREYPSISFISPGEVVHDICAQYNIGLYFPIDNNKNPIDPRTIPLQKICSDILGLDYVELKPKIKIPDRPRSVLDKYVCIGIHSTSQCKYWNYPNGWQKVVDYLKSIGYKVIHISKEKGQYMGNSCPRGIIDKSGDFPIEERIIDLKHADMFIGISSGLSWLSWAVGTPVILISGFTKPCLEFSEGVERIFNGDVCNGCWNDVSFQFDKGNWMWCPRNNGFECTKAITPDMIIQSIDRVCKKYI